MSHILFQKKKHLIFALLIMKTMRERVKKVDQTNFSFKRIKSFYIISFIQYRISFIQYPISFSIVYTNKTVYTISSFIVKGGHVMRKLFYDIKNSKSFILFRLYKFGGLYN